MISVITDPTIWCQVLIHPNNGTPKVWIAASSSAHQQQAYRVWGSLKRGGLQARASTWSEMVNGVAPAKRAKGYMEVPGLHQWFEIEQLVTAYRDGKPFLSIEGHRLGRAADNVVPDLNLEAALRKTSSGVLATGGNPFKMVSAEVPASSTRIMGKDDILNGVTASTGRAYAW